MFRQVGVWKNSDSGTGAIQRVHRVRDDSGVEVFSEGDLPEVDLKHNSLAHILGKASPGTCVFNSCIQVLHFTLIPAFKAG